MLGHISFMGFAALWDPGENDNLSAKTRFFLAGLAGGTALLFDYSGALFLLGLLAYGVAKRTQEKSLGDGLRHACWYGIGAIGPLCLLLFYQWKSFGHPFYPGQHWMPPVEWIDLGYQGLGWPQLELLVALAFDYRFGLFVTCPLMLLALASPYFNRGAQRPLAHLELASFLVFFMAFWVFFSGVNYTRLQFNTGIRYMAPIFPFLFIPTVIVLNRLPRRAVYFIAIISILQSWCLAMYRDVERGLGVLDPVVHVMFVGFKLPALTVLSRMGGQYGDYFSNGVSALPLFGLTAALLYGIWSNKLDPAKVTPRKKEVPEVLASQPRSDTGRPLQTSQTTSEGVTGRFEPKKASSGSS
jgi:hypothetical protein